MGPDSDRALARGRRTDSACPWTTGSMLPPVFGHGVIVGAEKARVVSNPSSVMIWGGRCPA
ncbi:hypothetical protein [Komagataeibacter saccharivorans]|uniref:hypothetical protein n=1 Tax=Komagataeibacter saccharivorans TaxID=265959 RepID=UPI0024A96DBE|nr:hypothetical protein [Komagataeibacter saccharivorans]